MATVTVAGERLEVHLHGDGPSLLLVQTALSAEEVATLGRHPSLRARHRVIDLRRRGYRILPASAPSRSSWPRPGPTWSAP